MYQTAPSIWTIGRDEPVILGVPFLSHTDPIKRSRGVAEPDFRLCVLCCAKHSQVSFCFCTQLRISNPNELTIGPWRYLFSRVPPQPNCPPAVVPANASKQFQEEWVVLQGRSVFSEDKHRRSYLCYAFPLKPQRQVAVKVHKVYASH